MDIDTGLVLIAKLLSGIAESASTAQRVGFEWEQVTRRMHEAAKEGRVFDASDLAYIKANAENALDELDEALGLVRDQGLDAAIKLIEENGLEDSGEPGLAPGEGLDGDLGDSTVEIEKENK